LRQIATVIAECATRRPADLAARYGGEEFACILPETDSKGAVAIAEKIRRAIISRAIPHQESTVADFVTASIGVVTVPCRAGGSAVDVVSLADTLLYRVKASGRNRVEYEDTRKIESEKNDHLVRLVWKDSFCCGNQLIDSQHQALFQVANELLEAVISLSPSTEIPVIISKLIDDVSQHFHDEEIILKKAGFPGISQHVAEHALLLKKGLKLSQRFKDSTLTVGDVFQFLASEIVMQHMLGVDLEYFPFINKAGD
jgi:hemerythrin-like metal-binding protein